jgi:autotransporter-associated beta strand protein
MPRSLSRRIHAALLRVGCAFALASLGSAATKRWDGDAGTTSWGSATNWAGNGVPGSGDDIIFDNTWVSPLPGVLSLGADRAARTLTFDTDDTLSLVNGSGTRALDLYNGTLTRTAGSSGTQTLAFSFLDLRANGSFDINGAGQLVISSEIRNDGGTRSINRTGTGTLTLSGSNTFSGGLTLTSGLTLLGHNSAAGTGTLTLAGGTLGGTGGARSIGNAVNASATIVIGGDQDLTFTNTFSLGAGNRTLQIDNTGNTTISGALSNAYYATTTKTGDGTLILVGNNATFAGPMVVADGTLRLESSNALGTSTHGNQVQAGATLALASAGSLSITEGAVDLAGTGHGGLGALRNVSGTNTLSATLNLTAATLIRSDAGSLTVGGLAPSGHDLTIDGAGAFSSTGALYNGGDLTLLGSGSRTFGAAVDVGSNILTVSSSGTNTFSGATTADGGIALTAGATTFASTLFGSGTATLSGSSATTANGIVQVGTIQISDTASATFTANVTASSGITIAGTGSVSFSGSQVSAGTSAFTVDTTADLTLGTKVVAGTFAQNGSGTTTLSGSTANQLASVNVNGGTLVLAKNAGTDAINAALTIGDGAGTDTVRLGAANQINNNVTVNLAASGVLDLNGHSDTITGLVFTGGTVTTGAGTLTLSSGSVVTNAATASANIAGNLALNQYNNTFNVANGTAAEDLIVSANVSGTNKRIVKTGAGTLVLSGTNTFADGGGATDAGLSIQAGTVVVSTDANLGNSGNNVSLTGGGRLQVDGTFTSGSGRQLNLDGAGTIDVTAGNTYTIQGVVAQAGALTKTGAGTLVFSGTGANTLSSATTVGAGTLELAKSPGTTALAANISINDTGTLRLAASNQISDTATVTLGAGVSPTFALNGQAETVGALASANSAAIVNLGSGGSLTVGGSNASTSYAGAITGSGTLTKAGSGTLTLTGTSNFSGTLSITAGTLLAGANNVLSAAAALTVASGATMNLASYTASVATIAGAGTVQLGSGSVLSVGGAGGSSVFGGTLAGSGTLEKVGAGDLTFSSNINFAGELRLNGGEVSLAGINLTVGTLRISGNTVLDFGASAASILSATNVIIDPSATLTITNWIYLQDYFFATAAFQQFGGPSAAFNVSGQSPQNQVVFSGTNANATLWQSWDRQITPTPEPAVYGTLLVGSALTIFGYRSWRSRRGAQSPATSRG